MCMSLANALMRHQQQQEEEQDLQAVGGEADLKQSTLYCTCFAS